MTIGKWDGVYLFSLCLLYAYINKSIITLRDATLKELEFYKQINANAGEPQIEEVERDESTNDWSITLSFPSNESTGTLFLPNSASTGVMNGRKYKTFLVNSESGEVISMKIRVLQR